MTSFATVQAVEAGGNGQPVPQRDAPAPGETWRKLAALGLVVAAIGLPINQYLSYGLLILCAVLVFTGTVTSAPSRWAAAALLTAVVIAGHTLLPAPRIEEGHNVFIGDAPEAASESGLPQEAFRLMAAQYARQYPAELHCEDEAHGCMRLKRSAEQNGYAFSADGIFGHPAFSRRVTGIDFSDPVSARLGVINERSYNWSDPSTDIQRFQRDRRFWKMFDRFQLTLPLFVMYRFPSAFVGSALCWRGDVLWEGPGERFATIDHAAMTCRTLQTDDVGRRIFGLSIMRNAPLTMNLKATPTIHVRRAIEAAFTLFGVAGIIALITRSSPRRTLLPLTLIAGALLVIAPPFRGTHGLLRLSRNLRTLRTRSRSSSVQMRTAVWTGDTRDPRPKPAVSRYPRRFRKLCARLSVYADELAALIDRRIIALARRPDVASGGYSDF